MLFPAALVLLVLSKVHAITKNGLTMAYAPPEEGLMRANARLGRIAVAGAVAAAPFGYLFLKIWGAAGPIYLAAVAYAVSAALNLRLPHPRMQQAEPRREVGPRGRIPELTGPAIGAVGMRAASGFLLFLLAFSLRDARRAGVVVRRARRGRRAGRVRRRPVRAAAPDRTRARRRWSSRACRPGAIGALLAFEVFGLPLLTVYAFVAGAASELSRLAFQSLMQRNAPEGAQGRVFVRYEVVFQLAWVGGAFIPALLPIDFRLGILILAAFYVLTGAAYFWHTRRRKGPARRSRGRDRVAASRATTP